MKYGTWNYGKWLTFIIPIATMMAQPTFPSTPQPGANRWIGRFSSGWR